MNAGMNAMNDRVLVMGIGNLLWADEGFGVRVVEALHSRYVFPESVTLLDGGTQGIYLLPFVQSAQRMLVVDAVDFHLPPGTLMQARNEEIPTYYGLHKMSLHQANFQELLSLAKLSNQHPEQTALAGVQPLDIGDYGGSLTAPVRAAVEPAVEAVLAILREWGVEATPREAPVEALSGSLALDDYEAGRPGESVAWRFGDARVVHLGMAAGNL